MNRDRARQKRFVRMGWSSLAGVLLLGACQKPPATAPAVAAAPPSAPASPPPAPPPPPPRCENLSENCLATPTTRVGVGAKPLTFAPPSGWKYAAGAERSTAVHPEGVGVLALSLASGADDAAIQAAIEREAVALAIENVVLKDLKRRWSKPDDAIDTGRGNLSLWEIDAKRQRGKAPKLKDRGDGTLLVGVLRSAGTEPALALGFVLDSAKDGDTPQLIMKAVTSLEGPPP